MAGIHDPSVVYVDPNESCLGERLDVFSQPKKDFSIDYVVPIECYPTLPITSRSKLFTISVEPQNTMVDLREVSYQCEDVLHVTKMRYRCNCLEVLNILLKFE